MTRQFSDVVRNAWGDSFETSVGTSPHLQLRSGAAPANCAAAATGTLLVDMALPADWLNAAASGTKTLLGSWAGTGAAAGTIGHYRIVNTAGTVCHEQGSVTATGGGGDMTVDNTSVALSQNVSVTAYNLTMPGA